MTSQTPVKIAWLTRNLDARESARSFAGAFFDQQEQQ